MNKFIAFNLFVELNSFYPVLGHESEMEEILKGSQTFKHLYVHAVIFINPQPLHHHPHHWNFCPSQGEVKILQTAC